ncbi:MAG: hypothetical protein U0232_32630, partial [Thermomicrobiales bacterium]
MIRARSRQPVRTRLTLALLLALTLVIPMLGTPAPALAAPQVDRFSIDLFDMFVVGGFFAGPDGALWFTQSDGTTESRIGRLNTDGSFSALVGVYDVLIDMTLGPDGNFWATARPGYTIRGQADRILRITPQMEITRYELPAQQSQPGSITAGPDGALWFTEGAGNRIGRITTGGTITEYPIPTPTSGPEQIVAGPDGALWFIESTARRIAKITTAGAFTEFPAIEAGSRITGLATGPDGRIWFSDTANKRLGALAMNGAQTFYQLSVAAPPYGNPAYTGPGELIAGPDGNLWVLIQNKNEIWRVTTDGVATPISLAFPDRPLDTIAVGPDGRIWYAKSGRIGAITTDGYVKEWQYGALAPPTIYPASDGGIWFFTNRNFGQTGQKLGRMQPNGYFAWIDLSPLPAQAQLHGAILGPNGALWCYATTYTGDTPSTALAQIADDGTITTTPLPVLGGTPGPLVFGPDGNRWFLLYGSSHGPGPYNRIARLTPDGQLTTFPLTDAFGIDYPLYASDLLVGPDGALWFAGPRSDTIGRITTSGQITKFPIATGNPMQSVTVSSLLGGSDGNLWFGGSIYDRALAGSQPVTGIFGKLTPSGQVSFLPVTSPTASGYSTIPRSPVLGPDGNIWFTLSDQPIYHKITPNGRIFDYQVSIFNYSSSPYFAFATHDSVWFASGTTIGRFRLGATSTLTTSATGSGTVSPGGTYPTGDEVSLTATPGLGSTFVGWRVDGNYRGWVNPLPVTVDGPTTAEALFVINAS